MTSASRIRKQIPAVRPKPGQRRGISSGWAFYFNPQTAEAESTEMYIDGFKVKLEGDTSYKGLWSVSFSLKEF